MKTKLNFAPPPRLFKRTLLFPGSFNPPGNHHVAIVSALAQITDVDEIRIVPIGHYGAKRSFVDGALRLQMVQAAFAGITDRIVIRDDKLASYPSNWGMQVELVTEPQIDLMPRFPGSLAMPILLRDVWHVIGADNVSKIRTEWNEGDRLWSECNWLIVSRVGHELPEPLPPNHRVLDGNGICAGESSTAIVARIEAGDEAWRSLVPPAVADIITAHNLYRRTDQ